MKAGQAKRRRGRNGKNGTTLVSFANSDMMPATFALTASQDTLIVSNATVYMMKDVSVFFGKAFTSRIRTGTVGEDLRNAKDKAGFVLRRTEGTKPASVRSVLDVPDVEHCLVFMSSSCDDNYIVYFTSKKSFAKKVSCVNGIAEPAVGIYAIRLQRASNIAMATLHVTAHVRSVRNSKIMRIDGSTNINKTQRVLFTVWT